MGGRERERDSRRIYLLHVGSHVNLNRMQNLVRWMSRAIHIRIHLFIAYHLRRSSCMLKLRVIYHFRNWIKIVNARNDKIYLLIDLIEYWMHLHIRDSPYYIHGYGYWKVYADYALIMFILQNRKYIYLASSDGLRYVFSIYCFFLSIW